MAMRKIGQISSYLEDCKKVETMRIVGFLGVCLLACCMLLSCTRVGPDTDQLPYVFWLNDRLIHPTAYSLEGDTRNLKPGDVIGVNCGVGRGVLFLTLGDERACRFVTGSPEDGRLLLRTPSGRLKVVGAVVEPVIVGPYHALQQVVLDPLTKMSPSEINQLWGLRIGGWPKGIAQRLRYVNPRQTCITLAGTLDGSLEKEALSSLWPMLRYLAIEDVTPNADYVSLGAPDALRFLAVRATAGGQEGFDMGAISQNKDLRSLDLTVWGDTLTNIGDLSVLTELRSMQISNCRSVDTIEFTKAMDRLRVLGMRRTAVSSLTPLSNSASIREIDASATDVRKLPTGELTSLRILNIISAKVDKETVEQFRRSHPQCAVYHSWMDPLRHAVQQANRLRAVPISIDHPQAVFFETTNSREIEQFLGNIEIDEERSGGVYRFEGHPILEFYEGDRFLLSLACIRGVALRWEDGPWPGDAALTDQSASFIRNWLLDKGI